MSVGAVNFDNIRKAVFIAGEPTTLDGDGFRELVVDFAKDTLRYDEFELVDKLMCIDLGVLTGSFGSEVAGDWDIFTEDDEMNLYLLIVATQMYLKTTHLVFPK